MFLSSKALPYQFHYSSVSPTVRGGQKGKLTLIQMWEVWLEICREMSESCFIHMTNLLVESPHALQMCMSWVYQAPGVSFLCLLLSWGCQFHPHGYFLQSFMEVLFSPHMKLEPCFLATHFLMKMNHLIFTEMACQPKLLDNGDQQDTETELLYQRQHLQDWGKLVRLSLSSLESSGKF